MPSYTLKDIKAARESVRADMVAEHNEMYGTNHLTSNHLNGLEVEARLQTYLRFGVALDELEPVASEEPFFASRDEFDNWANKLLPDDVKVISIALDDAAVSFCVVHQGKCVYPVLRFWNTFPFDEHKFADDIMGEGGILEIINPVGYPSLGIAKSNHAAQQSVVTGDKSDD